MHELGIAQSIVENVCNEMHERGIQSISAVGVRVGVMCGVMNDALKFGYQAVANGTALEGSRLTITEDPLHARCHVCGSEFSTSKWVFACDRCGSGEIRVEGGDCLKIAWLETEDP